MRTQTKYQAQTFNNAIKAARKSLDATLLGDWLLTNLVWWFHKQQGNTIVFCVLTCPVQLTSISYIFVADK